MTTIDGSAVGRNDRGDGPGCPLLLLHGFTGSKEDFDAVLDGLAADRRVVAVDLPGHGDTPGPDDPGGYGIAATAAWCLRLADALDLGEFHLLGHSFGGLVAQSVAAAASQRLRSLILADSGMGAPRDEAADMPLRVALAARDEGMEAAWAQLNSPGGGPRAPHPDEGDERERFVRQRFLDQDPVAIVGTARALLGAAPYGAFLRGIDIPVLVISGADDEWWTTAEQAELTRVVRGARGVVVPDAGHVPQVENPKEWLVAVTDFLAAADGLPPGNRAG